METSKYKWEVVREAFRPNSVRTCAVFDTKSDAVKYMDALFFNAPKEGKVVTWGGTWDTLYSRPLGSVRYTCCYYCRPIENA